MYTAQDQLGADFNPRSYKRSDVLNEQGYALFFISIHAPTRGATLISL